MKACAVSGSGTGNMKSDQSETGPLHNPDAPLRPFRFVANERAPGPTAGVIFKPRPVWP